MTIAAETDCWAYLKIISKRPLAAIESHIGRKADGRSWSVGDARRRPGQRPYDFSFWSWESGAVRGEPLDTHLRCLWRRLEPFRQALIDLPEDMKAYAQCVGKFATHQNPVSIASGHFATAASYRLVWDFDFYFGDEFGHDEMPYWKW